MNDVKLNKAASIRRCLVRIGEEYQGNPANLANQTRQDAIVLNLQRACECAIDLAMHEVSARKLGVPQTSREGFTLLEQAGILSADAARHMKAMVGFRNIAVHDYQTIQEPILEAILSERLGDFEAFLAALGL